MTRELLQSQERIPVPLSNKALAEVRAYAAILEASTDQVDKIKFHILRLFLENGNRPLSLHDLFAKIPWPLEKTTLYKLDNQSFYTNLEKVITRLRNKLKDRVFLGSANEGREVGQSEQLYVLKERQAAT